MAASRAHPTSLSSSLLLSLYHSHFYSITMSKGSTSDAYIADGDVSIQIPIENEFADVRDLTQDAVFGELDESSPNYRNVPQTIILFFFLKLI